MLELSGHNQEVNCLDSKNGLIISGSRDRTTRVRTPVQFRLNNVMLTTGVFRVHNFSPSIIVNLVAFSEQENVTFQFRFNSCHFIDVLAECHISFPCHRESVNDYINKHANWGLLFF